VRCILGAHPHVSINVPASEHAVELGSDPARAHASAGQELRRACHLLQHQARQTAQRTPGRTPHPSRRGCTTGSGHARRRLHALLHGARIAPRRKGRLRLCTEQAPRSAVRDRGRAGGSGARAQLAQHGGRDGEAGELAGHGGHLVVLVVAALEAAAGALLEVAHQLGELRPRARAARLRAMPAGARPRMRAHRATRKKKKKKKKKRARAGGARCWGWRPTAAAARRPCMAAAQSCPVSAVSTGARVPCSHRQLWLVPSERPAAR